MVMERSSVSAESAQLQTAVPVFSWLPCTTVNTVDAAT
ncbi:hypothetical protein CJF32_00001041 [Rutstroemia sp. NJR-2017a WRK4]|nr:hypothetical protein CJF32_00005025 [Rutstroemia sp. NJR-2017a WRK4]PQE32313.1 hypothetical protein CJF32_00001041 [Rutstroemia sp. NJR-2017a WRK4]